MTMRLPNLSTRYAFFALLWMVQAAAAVEVGETYVTKDNRTYQISAKVGKGSAGQVWAVNDLQSGMGYAVKFFENIQLDQRQISIYGDIAQLQNDGELSGLVRVYGPEDFWLGSQRENRPITVVRFELASGHLENHPHEFYSLLRNQNSEALIEKITRIRRLIEGGIKSLLQLRKYKINHHDLNPRNILELGSLFKFGDLDNILPYGEPPREQAWEAGSAPLEYSLGNYHYNDGNLSDAFQFATAVYSVLFEAYPLALFKKAYHFTDIWTLRAELVTNISVRKTYESFVAATLQIRKEELVAKLESQSYQAKADLDFIFDFLNAGVKMDIQERANLLTSFWDNALPPSTMTSNINLGTIPSIQSVATSENKTTNTGKNFPISGRQLIRSLTTIYVASSLHVFTGWEISNHLAPPLSTMIGLWGSVGGFIYGVKVAVNAAHTCDSKQSNLQYCKAALKSLGQTAYQLYWTKGFKPFFHFFEQACQ